MRLFKKGNILVLSRDEKEWIIKYAKEKPEDTPETVAYACSRKFQKTISLRYIQKIMRKNAKIQSHLAAASAGVGSKSQNAGSKNPGSQNLVSHYPVSQNSLSQILPDPWIPDIEEEPKVLIDFEADLDSILKSKKYRLSYITYGIIRSECKQLQKSGKYEHNQDVQSSEFCEDWISAFVERKNMRKIEQSEVKIFYPWWGPHEADL